MQDAIRVAQDNFDSFDGMQAAVEVVEADVRDLSGMLKQTPQFHVDTVITNPPFG